MKVGLMTWFRYNNYGTILQAYALQNVLNNNNYNSILIDYMPRGTIKNITNVNDFFKIIILKLRGNKYIVNNSSFDEFIDKNLNITEKCNNYYNLKMLSDNLDAIICGSDQIWSPDCFDINYFLPFADENKIMSYAPSFGKNDIYNNEISLKMKKMIDRFNILSIREQTGRKIIKKLCNKDAVVTLDPTFLLTRDEWCCLIDNELEKEIKNKKYILCYFLGNSNRYYDNVLKISKKYNMEIINIPTKKNQKLNKFSMKTIVGPKEFITLIKNSSLVLTDSFHGTIFSLIFNCNFYTYKRFKDNDKKSQNSRVVDLLNSLNLNDKLICPNQKDMTCMKINFNKINEKINNMRNESLKFLFDGLKTIQNNKTKADDNCITDLCCGCGACKTVCCKNAIDISLNNEGFYHYSKDNKKCINCNLCKKVCPMVNISATTISYENKCYYFKSSNKNVLNVSSSGGAGYEIANYYNKQGYYVCGAAYDKSSKRTKHIIIKPNSNEELKKIQGSKYLQSYTYDAFKELLLLPLNSKVVFFGTPCQVSAIDKITKIKKIRSNFILIDLICHGVPSYYLWDKYLDEINKKYCNNNLINVIFRNKKYGWKDRRISLYNKNFHYTKRDNKDIFYKFFKNGYVDNNCCYECPFRASSAADIKIGDYWKPEYFDDKDGASMIIAINKNGEKIINELSAYNTVIEQPINDFFKYQYTSNMSPNIWRNKIIKELNSNKKLSSIYYSYFKYDDLKEKLSNIYYRRK